MKKLLALILAGAMALSMAACGGSDSSSGSATVSTPGSGASGAASTAGGDHTFETDYWATLTPDDPVTWDARQQLQAGGHGRAGRHQRVLCQYVHHGGGDLQKTGV